MLTTLRTTPHLRASGPLAALAVCLALPSADSWAQTKITASELVVNGESFFAASNIRDELNRLARADGYIGANESFRQVAVSGASISAILNQYKGANPKPKYLVTDGGGIDLMQSCGGTPTTNCTVIKNTLNTAQQYFTEMKNSGTKAVLWMRYPDPIGSQWATLKANHDVYNPEVEKICGASTEPKCLWVDLRTTWNGKSNYTDDGIHCTAAGGTATAQAFWAAMKTNDFFNLQVTPVLQIAPSARPSQRLRFVQGVVAMPSAYDQGLSQVRGVTVSGKTLWLSPERALP